MLTMCNHVSFLEIGYCVTEIEMVGKEVTKSPLRTVKLMERLPDKIIKELITGMKEVIDLEINCSESVLLKTIIPACPELQIIHIKDFDQFKNIWHLIPSHIQLIWKSELEF